MGTVPCENLSQKHFSVGVVQRESKTPVLCPLLFCVTSVSVPSNQGNFAILPLLEELWAQLFEGVFHNLTFVSRLRGWPWPRSEPEQGDHQSSWLLLHSPESSFPTQSWEGAFPTCLAKEWGCDCPCLFQDIPRFSFVSFVTSSLDVSCSEHETPIGWEGS